MGYTDQQIVGDIIATVHEDDREKIKELFCECYCRFETEFLEMYKDPDVALAEMERQRCNYCPLNKI